jgi:DNA polymerase III epsilon subunit-like protein
MLCFLDTETTGTDPDKNRIIQLYAEIPKIGESINIEMRPEDGEVEPKALEVNGLTMEQIQDPSRMTQKEGMLALKRWITKHYKGRRAQVVAHNAEFDCRFVHKTVERELNSDAYRSMFHYQWECTLKLFLTLRNLRRIHPVSLKLGDLAHYFGLPTPTHEASADVKCTIQLYKVYYDVMTSLPKEVWQNGETKV